MTLKNEIISHLLEGLVTKGSLSDSVLSSSFNMPLVLQGFSELNTNKWNKMNMRMCCNSNTEWNNLRWEKHAISSLEDKDDWNVRVEVD